MPRPRKHIEVLPPPVSPEFDGGRVYYHVLLSPAIIERLKATAGQRGYKPGPFLEAVLDAVLPLKIVHKNHRTLAAKVRYTRSKEKR